MPYNVLGYPIYGDGVHDDTDGFQAFLDTAFANGGGSLIIPKPTAFYKLRIKSALGYALKLRPRVNIYGEGCGLVKFKLDDNQGDYQSLFAHDISESIDDVEISGITFDQNRQNNPVTYANEAAWLADNLHARMAIRVYEAKRFTVAGCRFINCDNINTLTANGDHTCEDIRFVDNLFDAGSSPIDHDHSSIYISATRAYACGNTFVGSGNGARSAFDLHQGSIICMQNIADGYQIGANVVSNATIIKDNLFNVPQPIRIGWGSTLERVVISNNV